MHLRRNYHRRFSREFWPLIAHHNSRGSDLLQRHFRRMSFGSRKNVMITASSTTADHFFRNGQSVGIRRRRDQGHSFVRGALCYLMVTNTPLKSNPTSATCTITETVTPLAR
jgi:hypothetical protein